MNRLTEQEHERFVHFPWQLRGVPTLPSSSSRGRRTSDQSRNSQLALEDVNDMVQSSDVWAGSRGVSISAGAQAARAFRSHHRKKNPWDFRATAFTQGALEAFPTWESGVVSHVKRGLQDQSSCSCGGKCKNGKFYRHSLYGQKGKYPTRKAGFPGFPGWISPVMPRMMLTTFHPSNVDDFHPQSTLRCAPLFILVNISSLRKIIYYYFEYQICTHKIRMHGICLGQFNRLWQFKNHSIYTSIHQYNNNQLLGITLYWYWCWNNGPMASFQLPIPLSGPGFGVSLMQKCHGLLWRIRLL